MWFNNLQIFRFTQPFTLDAQKLNEKAEQFRFKPCGKLQLASYGWVSPLGKHSEELVHTNNGNMMICARKDEKILPASVIRELVDEKVVEIEDMQGKKLRKKEKEAIKDEVIHDLLPRAFLRNHRLFAYIAPRDNMIVINATNNKKAEELLEYLRRTLDTLPVKPMVPINSPETIMTQWVTGEDVPHDIIVNDECELHDTAEEGGIIRCKQQNLAADEIQAHISAGKRVVKLAITWQESLSCIVNENFSINRLKFSDEILDQADSEGTDDYAAQFDEDFSIMVLELQKFIPRLAEVFGGENDTAHTSITETTNKKSPEKMELEDCLR